MLLEGRKRGTHGVRSSGTLRCYPWDAKQLKKEAFLRDPDRPSVELSAKNLQNQDLLDRSRLAPVSLWSEIKLPKKATQKTPVLYGGGHWEKVYVGRSARKPIVPKDSVILHKGGATYPLFRERHTKMSGPCGCCMQRDGRIWMLRGTGPKSSLKTKVLRRQTRYDLRTLFDF